MSKPEILKRIKAAVLAGTMAASLSACTKEEETDLQNSLDAARYEQEESTRTTTAENNTQETKTKTVEETIKENTTEVTEETTTNNNGETVETTTKGKFMTPTTTAKNNNTNSNNTTKNNTTTPVVTQTPVTTKQQVTTKATTTTAVQTQAPTTTAAPVTTTPIAVKQNYTKYDLLDSDADVATRAYEELTKQFKKDLYNNYIIDGVYGDTDGYYECKAMLAMLNHDQGISPEVLSNVFEEYSEEEFYTYADTLAFAALENLMKSNVDFTKYMLDEELAEFINNTNQAWTDSYTGKNTNLDTILKEYFENNNFSNTDEIDDYLKFYYAIIAKQSLDRGMAASSLKSGKKLYEDNIIKPIYDSYKEYTYVNK